MLRYDCNCLAVNLHCHPSPVLSPCRGEGSDYHLQKAPAIIFHYSPHFGTPSSDYHLLKVTAIIFAVSHTLVHPHTTRGSATDFCIAPGFGRGVCRYATPSMRFISMARALHARGANAPRLWHARFIYMRSAPRAACRYMRTACRLRYNAATTMPQQQTCHLFGAKPESKKNLTSGPADIAGNKKHPSFSTKKTT